LKGRERAELRAEAHHLNPTVHVGQHGLTPTLIGSLDDALRTRELVKVKLGIKGDVKPKDVANSGARDELCGSAGDRAYGNSFSGKSRPRQEARRFTTLA